MTELLDQALHDWQNFYIMAGTSSATLTGLLFVAVSLGTHMVTGREDSVRTFVTPTLVHFISVLLVAAVMLIPTHTAQTLAFSLLVVGAVTTSYCLQIVLQMSRGLSQDSIQRAHWVWHGGLPLLSYGTLAGVAIWLLVGSASGPVGQVAAFDALAASAILLLVIGIHNTWDLVLWLAKNR